MASLPWSLDQLEAFVTAAQTGSFTASARKLGKAQSRVSTAIANLEADLGFLLFDRSGKYPVLTEDGKNILNDAIAVLSQCQRLHSRALSVSSGTPVTFSIAMDEAVPIEHFENLYTRLAESHPHLTLTILNGSQQDIARWVEDGRADIGFLIQDHVLPDSLERMSIVRCGQALIVAEDHPLARVPAPTENQLVKHRQLVIRGRLGDTLGKPLSPDFWHVDSFYLISSLVMRGIGWALIPEHVAKTEWYTVKKLSTENISTPPDYMLAAVKRRDTGWNEVMEWIFDETCRLFNQ
ncbi:LysR family transcriptional regulator [Parasalinivibrio latis]|uniref:LysR family transcriptional regulator n=1 Tax=Parasalinivibrio latis TaxID=2952610 RepID=UPI0030E5F801